MALSKLFVSSRVPRQYDAATYAQFFALLEDFINNKIPQKKTGTFTLDADASTTVNDADVRTDSTILLMPTNAAAATLIGSSEGLYVSARTSGTSFAVSTADGGNAAGTETFQYIILN